MSLPLSSTLALLRADNYSASLAQYMLFHLLLLTAGITIPAVWKELNILSFDRWLTKIWVSLSHEEKNLQNMSPKNNSYYRYLNIWLFLILCCS